MNADEEREVWTQAIARLASGRGSGADVVHVCAIVARVSGQRPSVDWLREQHFEGGETPEDIACAWRDAVAKARELTEARGAGDEE